MAKHKIVVNAFSQKSVEDAIKALQSYQDYLTYKCQQLAEKLAEKGVEIARVQVAELDAVFTSELLSSIHAEYRGTTKNGGVWAVVADSSHAIFVEFGTGVIGKANPYTGTLPEGVKWEYASGKTIRQLSDGRYGWFYKGTDGNWYFTEGMPSRPFMYNTANELRSIIISTAKEVFG